MISTKNYVGDWIVVTSIGVDDGGRDRRRNNNYFFTNSRLRLKPARLISGKTIGKGDVPSAVATGESGEGGSPGDVEVDDGVLGGKIV